MDEPEHLQYKTQAEGKPHHRTAARALWAEGLTWNCTRDAQGQPEHKYIYTQLGPANCQIPQKVDLWLMVTHFKPFPP